MFLDVSIYSCCITNSLDFNSIVLTLLVSDQKLPQNVSRNFSPHYVTLDQDRVIGVATRYGLDVPGIESGQEWDFRRLSRRVVEPKKPPIKWVRFSFSGLKRLGRGVGHPTSSIAEFKEWVQLYVYFPYMPSWSVLRWNLLFLLDYVSLLSSRIQKISSTYVLRHCRGIC